MQKCLQNILLFIAVITVAGHSIIPHFHYDAEQAVEKHHHEEGEDDHHSIFSFAQLDEDFVPSQFSKVSIDLPILYLLTPVIANQFKQLKENSKSHFSYYREFPPPGNYSFNLFSRPPPAC
jgi:hypothetical protein